MKKLLLTMALTSVLAGCGTLGTTEEKEYVISAVNVENFLSNGETLIQNQIFEFSEGHFVMLMQYINTDDQLCTQYLSEVEEIANKDNHVTYNATISEHCGSYEEVKEIVISSQSSTNYIPTDIEEIQETTSNGVTIQTMIPVDKTYTITAPEK